MEIFIWIFLIWIVCLIGKYETIILAILGILVLGFIAFIIFHSID